MTPSAAHVRTQFTGQPLTRLEDPRLLRGQAAFLDDLRLPGVRHVAIARSMNIPVGFPELAVIVPVSFIVQMIPLSVNGFGVREATFGFYFQHLGLPLESALLVSFVGAALIMLFSLSGGIVYLRRSVLF